MTNNLLNQYSICYRHPADMSRTYFRNANRRVSFLLVEGREALESALADLSAQYSIVSIHDGTGKRVHI